MDARSGGDKEDEQERNMNGSESEIQIPRPNTLVKKSRHQNQTNIKRHPTQAQIFVALS